MQTYQQIVTKEEIKGSYSVAHTLLQAAHPLFLKMQVSQETDRIVLESQEAHLYTWEQVQSFDTEEKLRHLVNIGPIYGALMSSKYTYRLAPDNVLFDLNATPQLIYRGIVNQVKPYEAMTVASFVKSYQAMIVSLLDKRTTYEGLMSGKLEFYKGNLFCEKILAETHPENIVALLEARYEEEKMQNRNHFTKIANKTATMLKMGASVSMILAAVSLLGLLYITLVTLPYQELVAHLRLSFIKEDYSAVISEARNVDGRVLTQDDKYILAYSVIMTEPLTAAQRSELSNMSTQSNEAYLRYWILIGQAKNDEAIDIASYLDDPQLLMYGMTKKIDEIQRDPDLTAEARTTQLESYKNKLEELKKQYLTIDELLLDETSSSDSSTE